MSTRELLKGNSPTLILAILKEGPLHGYAIARAIEQRSGDALEFKDGTLYPTLQALETDGFILGEWEQGSGERKRKIYYITPGGLAELEKRTRTWNDFSSAVNSILGGPSNAETPIPGTS